ncbi:hypothetical protein F5X96DRAFT_695488 [Biscogniauxia mediterranea]|nr:hypothetical protein F5X96DRAFT_695488 [Biscogniauxia mediterranea]
MYVGRCRYATACLECRLARVVGAWPPIFIFFSPMPLEPTVLGWDIRIRSRKGRVGKQILAILRSWRDVNPGFAVAVMDSHVPTDILPPLSGLASLFQKAYGLSAGKTIYGRKTEIPGRFTSKTNYHRGGLYRAVLEMDTARGRRDLRWPRAYMQYPGVDHDEREQIRSEK